MNEQTIKIKETIDLQRIKEYCEKATPGPWHRNIKPTSKYPTVFAGRNDHILSISGMGKSEEIIEGNINFITQARTDLPKLVQEIERLQKKLGIISESEEVTEYE